MYSIYADGVLIHDDQYADHQTKVLNPKLSLGDCNAGSLTMTIPVDNPGYSTIKRMISEIVVKKEGKEIWSGRVLEEKEDFWKQRQLTCEGELAYLNDTTQPPHEYHNMDVRDFLEALISVHNSKVTDDKKFTIGIVTVSDPNDSLYRYTNRESTLACINDKLVDKLGGHLRVRKDQGVRYIDYLSDYLNTNTQVIEFGSNLLDFSKNWNLTDLATVCLPLGRMLEDEEIPEGFPEALQAYLTVESVNQGSPYVVGVEARETYGWIEQVVSWDDVTEPSRLLTKAQEWLKDNQFEKMELELSAVDLHYMNPEIEAIGLLDRIRCVSAPHGMDRYFPVSKVIIPLDKPEETTYTLGDSIKPTLTDTTSGIADDYEEKIEKSESETLKRAKDNATRLINLGLNGFVTIVHGENGTSELIISDAIPWENSSRLWRWNIAGLGYADHKIDDNVPYGEMVQNEEGEWVPNTFQFGLAMTMDGSIVADYITSGVLDADIIRGGVLKGRNGGSSYWNMETGELHITQDVLGAVNQASDWITLKDNKLLISASEIKVNGISIAGEDITNKINWVESAREYFAEGDSGGIAPLGAYPPVRVIRFPAYVYVSLAVYVIATSTNNVISVFTNLPKFKAYGKSLGIDIWDPGSSYVDTPYFYYLNIRSIGSRNDIKMYNARLFTLNDLDYAVFEIPKEALVKERQLSIEFIYPSA